MGRRATPEIREALQNVPSATSESTRDSQLALPTKKITRHEVKTIRYAILHPREKADPISFALSLVTAVGVLIKAVATAAKTGQPSWEDLVLASFGLAMAIALATRFAGQFKKKSPLHDLAVESLDDLFPPENAGATAPRAPFSEDGETKVRLLSPSPRRVAATTSEDAADADALAEEESSKEEVKK